MKEVSCVDLGRAKASVQEVNCVDLGGAKASMKEVICVDLGGTKANVVVIRDGKMSAVQRYDVPSSGSLSEVNQFIRTIVAHAVSDNTVGIAIGVPSMVDMVNGVVLETVNIPAWQNVPLKAFLELQFAVPVVVHNDANCFAMGEFAYGDHDVDNLVAVTLGTGLGAGLILNGQLYTGKFAAAGEFGSFPYRDGVVEDFTSGKFFRRLGLDGAVQAELAKQGDATALAQFASFGQYLGEAIALTVLAFNPDKVVLGGSVAQSFGLFAPAMQASLEQLLHPLLVPQLSVVASQLSYAPLLGAYALFCESYEVSAASCCA
ncbi:ROK family protein [Pseudoalteromonas fenneropenaei]|uniref:ROK family protein n=1 Tax=Pseudoalteromonas fenneropenaei TaxID=1737459 RepID=A0ABV7CMA9_9GAMM